MGIREALQAEKLDVLPAPGHLERELRLRRRHHGLPPRLPQLSSGTSFMARPEHAVLPKGPAAHPGFMRGTRRPYVKEPVLKRTMDLVDIMVGKTSMRKYPTAYE